MQSPLIFIAFFFSGAAGLIYQVVWVRDFGNVFGNTIHSASLVTAVFMLGLGFGSYLAGRWIDRDQSDVGKPVRAYAAAEIFIGVAALLVGLMLPNLEALSAAISSYSVDAHGWHMLSVGSIAARYVVALVLLFPITMAMGATLTLLVRYLVLSHLDEAGWKIGVLYGINTGGAALGAFLTDYALVPAIGLTATMGVAVVCNFSAAGLALWTARRREPTPAVAAEAEPAADAPTGGADRRMALVAAAILLTGFAGMGTEIVWFRYLNVLLGGYRGVFSLLLTVMLVAMWAGSVAGGALHRRLGRAGVIFVVAQAGVVVSTLGLLWLNEPQSAADYVRESLLSNPGADWDSWGAQTAWHLRQISAVVALPAFLMGFAFPIANALVQDAREQIGRRAGALYLANTVGSVAGSLVTGFLLLPSLGTQNALLVIGTVSATATVCLVLAGIRGTAERAIAGVAVTCAIVAVAGWSQIAPGQILLRHASPGLAPDDRELTRSEGIYEVISIVEHPDGSRQLNTNGHSMSGTSFTSARYMRLFAHVPLLHLDAPTDVVVICFGVGNTVNAASLHPIKNLEVVDLSRQILDHAHYFASTNHDVLEDPRVHVFVQDGRSHLLMQPDDKYDLVTLEPPPISFAGVSALYSREFYEIARAKLKPDGFVTQWLPFYQVSGESNLAIIKAFLEVFPDAILLCGAQRELILVGQKSGAPKIDLDALIRRIDERPAVAADLASIGVKTPADFLATFVASSKTLTAATAAVPPVTDDWPIMEYSVTSNLLDTEIPASVFAPQELPHWCPSCWHDRVMDPRITDLDAYLSILAAIYPTESYRHYRPARGAIPLKVVLPPEYGPIIERANWLRLLLEPSASSAMR